MSESAYRVITQANGKHTRLYDQADDLAFYINDRVAIVYVEEGEEATTSGHIHKFVFTASGPHVCIANDSYGIHISDIVSVTRI